MHLDTFETLHVAAAMVLSAVFAMIVLATAAVTMRAALLWLGAI